MTISIQKIGRSGRPGKAAIIGNCDTIEGGLAMARGPLYSAGLKAFGLCDIITESISDCKYKMTIRPAVMLFQAAGY